MIELLLGIGVFLMVGGAAVVIGWVWRRFAFPLFVAGLVVMIAAGAAATGAGVLGNPAPDWTGPTALSGMIVAVVSWVFSLGEEW